MTASSVSVFVPPYEDRPRLAELPWWCGADATNAPRRFLDLFPQSSATPLYHMDGLGKAIGVAGLYVKDESTRFNLSSFKALGGAYAVFRVAHHIAEAHLGRSVDPRELLKPEIRALMARLTVCCASDGNHGRSVAYGARLIGAVCKVFLHSGVSAERVSHIERQGASIVRVNGSYDESVIAARNAAADEGWTLVPDITAPDDKDGALICGFVMEGYSILVDEILTEVERQGVRFTHVFVQAGVGGLAASVFGHWAARVSRRPRFVVVEPKLAPCLLESARKGEPVTLEHNHPTIMAMLECQRPSPLAWPIVHAFADAYVAVSEDDARSAVKELAWPHDADPAIEAGESGAAGLAGVVRALRTPGAIEGLGAEATVLVLATEGPTDRSVWSGR
jgi:diaminopropionate ammonia-lyase